MQPLYNTGPLAPRTRERTIQNLLLKDIIYFRLIDFPLRDIITVFKQKIWGEIKDNATPLISQRREDYFKGWGL